MKHIAVALFASGAGTTAEAFIRSGQTLPDNPCETKLVICNAPKAGVFDRVAQLNRELGTAIQTVLINSKTHPALPGEDVPHGRQTDAEQAAILAALQAQHIDLVVLMGYMKHVGAKLVEAYGWLPTYQSIYETRMLNTHPGLLPLTQGLSGVHVQEKTLDTHAGQAGQTLHLVSADYDDGPTIAEHRTPVRPGETAAALFARVQHIEKSHIARDIANFAVEQQAYKEKAR